MRLLITGSYGQLGNELRRLLETGQAEIGPIPEVYRDAQADFIDYDQVDISSQEAVDTWFAANGPYDVVVNCAAITNVDGCETGEDLAMRVNAGGPANLAKASQACGAVFVQVSTDYVFPGTDPVPRKETDEVAPKSAYGRTKLEGERLAMECCERTHVVRTAWLYGYVGKNFVKTMLRLAENHDAVTVVNDQLGNPTSANDLAYEILKIALSDSYGVWHATNNGTCSWADLAEAAIKRSGLPCEVKRCTSAEYKEMNPASADRPAYSSLENAHLASTIGDEMRPWEEALDMYMSRLEELGN